MTAARKLTSPDANRTHRIDIRVSPHEHELFKQAAALAGYELSTWIRAKIRAAVRQEFQHARLPKPEF